MRSRSVGIVVIAWILLALPLVAVAQDQGWEVRLRGISINPNDSSDTISGLGSKVAVDSAFVPELDFVYRFQRHFGLELILATARHDLEATGGLLPGYNLGSVRILPPTLTFQYYFTPNEKFEPYVGVGVNWTQFSSYDLPTGLASLGVRSLEFSDSFNAAAQVGMDVKFDKHWLFNVDVKYIWLDTDVGIKLVTGGTLDTINVKINPWVFGIGVGYKF
jgi:outer membrane protein